MSNAAEETAAAARAGHPGSPAVTDHDRELAEIDLLTPLRLRQMTLRNRIGVSPMCQYVARDGLADDWHLVHLGSRAAGGAGLVMVEATAVTPQGRITPGDLGLWDDHHIEPLSRIVRFVHRQRAVIGIQLAHAGRKASCDVPWQGGRPLTADEGAWPVVGPSKTAFGEGYPTPQPLDANGLASVIEAFALAARRAVQAGFDVIELHMAHGYLLHSFLSPLSNRRRDRYGGSLDNRMRLPLEVVRLVRQVIPEGMPLFVRVSATDWSNGGWDVDQTVALAKALKKVGTDLIDVSSGGLIPHAAIPVAKGYQVPFAARVRGEAKIATASVGLITEPDQANEVVQRGCADLVFVGRAMLREPYWGLRAEAALGGEPNWPLSYGYAVSRRDRKK